MSFPLRRTQQTVTVLLLLLVGVVVQIIEVHGTMMTGTEEVDVDLKIPFPLTISMDDAGWQGGSILNKDTGGPYRMGMDRDPTLDDYQTLVTIAQQSGTRLQTLWVLSELDRNQICAKPQYNLPLAPNDITEFGLQWDNSKYINDGNLILMEYVRKQSAWLELGLHAVRHEHWPHAGAAGELSEFGRPDSSQTWGFKAYINVLDCFTELLRQYYDEETCSFPRSFIAPGHKYYYDQSDLNHSTGAAVSSYGVKYTQRFNKPDHFDGSLYSTNRRADFTYVDWDQYGGLPRDYHEPEKAYLNTHPPNMFDPSKISTWVDWLTGINQLSGRYLPKNTVQTYSQILYSKHATVTHRTYHYTNTNTDASSIVGQGSLTIDTTKIPQEAYQHEILGTLCLKLESNTTITTKKQVHHLASVSIDYGAQVMAYWRDEVDQDYILIGNPHQPMGRLEPNVYQVNYTTSYAKILENVVVLEKPWTYEVVSLIIDQHQAQLTVEMYGRQTIKLRLANLIPTQVKSQNNQNLRLEHWEWDATAKELIMDLTGKDMQGETGTILVTSTTSSSSILRQPHVASSQKDDYYDSSTEDMIILVSSIFALVLIVRFIPQLTKRWNQHRRMKQKQDV